MRRALWQMNGIGLVETDGNINIAMGYQRSAPCAEELFSKDPAVISEYLQKNFQVGAAACCLGGDDTGPVRQ